MNKKGNSSGWAAAILCKLFGMLILMSVVLSALCLVVPRFMGYEIYHEESGSLEPEIPAGSMLYVEKTEPVNIREDDRILYRSGDSVVLDRVIQNRQVEGELVLSDDGESSEELRTVSYAMLKGRVVFHVPYLGGLLILYTSTVGKLYVIGYAACGIMLFLLAGCISRRRRERITMELQREIMRKEW